MSKQTPCKDCTNCITEPHNGHSDYWTCLKWEERRRDYLAERGESADSFFFAPCASIHVGTSINDGCKYFAERVSSPVETHRGGS